MNILPNMFTIIIIRQSERQKDSLQESLEYEFRTGEPTLEGSNSDDVQLVFIVKSKG